MMRKIRDFSLRISALRAFGLLFLAAGLMGNVLQRSLGVGVVANSQLWQAMQDSPSTMVLATLALAFQALEACAVPVFCFLLVEGAIHTSGYRNYLLRVLLLAAVCELPYNLAVSGRLIAPDSLNPVFGMAVCLAMLYFFRHYPEKKAGHVAVKAAAVIGAFLWSNIFRIAGGSCCVLLVTVLWSLRDRENLRILAGILTMVACSVLSPFYLAGALAFLPLYFYEDERKAKCNRLVNYLSYPVLLLAFWLVPTVFA